jgi:enoyl-CoA hydratase/carnithine racemase
MTPSPSPDAADVLVERRAGDAVWITLNRPRKHNALAGSVLGALRQAVVEAGADPRTRYLVLTGAGERYFAAGGDLVQLTSVRTSQDVEAMVEHARGALDSIRQCPVPVVAYLNGDAIGGGAELAVACDLRLVNARARIGYIQARLAISSGWGGGTDLCQLIGAARAMRMMARCDMVDAEQALAWGLADAVIDVPERDLAAFLKQFDEASPHVLRGIKAQTAAWRLGTGYAERRAIEQHHFTAAWVHDDHWRAADRILSREKP